MITLKQRKSKVKSFLFLISIILCISLSFLLLSCGAGPTLKTADPEKGQFAVDFGENPPDTGAGVTEVGFVSLAKSIGSLAPNPPDFSGEFTIESWVKRNNIAGSLNGAIFSRAWDNAGIMLFACLSEPRFAMRKESGSLYYVAYGPTYGFPMGLGVGSANNVWMHIAVSLTTEDHSAGSNDCATVGAQTPHIALYVNGNLQNCATTGSNYSDALTTDSGGFEVNEQIGRSQVATATAAWSGIFSPYGTGNSFNSGSRVYATIDEVRFWKVAKTQTQIQECMYKELSTTTGGNCGIDSTLIGYWKFNGGTGTNIADHSGTGNSGTKNYCDENCTNSSATSIDWYGGWVTGYPF